MLTFGKWEVVDDRWHGQCSVDLHNMRLPRKYAGNVSNGGIECICHLVPLTLQVYFVVYAYLVFKEMS